MPKPFVKTISFCKVCLEKNDRNDWKGQLSVLSDDSSTAEATAKYM